MAWHNTIIEFHANCMISNDNVIVIVFLKLMAPLYGETATQEVLKHITDNVIVAVSKRVTRHEGGGDGGGRGQHQHSFSLVSAVGFLTGPVLPCFWPVAGLLCARGANLAAELQVGRALVTAVHSPHDCLG